VVVGTVIDPEMKDEIRVTVVATGLGRGDAEVPDQTVRLAIKNTGELDYGQLERPTVMRHQTVAVAGGGRHGAASQESDLEYLDIPAFLRRQAD